MVVTRSSTIPEDRLNVGFVACIIGCVCFWVAVGVSLFLLLT